MPGRPTPGNETGNHLLLASVVLSFWLVILMIFVSSLQHVFGTEPLSMAAAAIVAGLSVVPAALTEATKLLLRRSSRS